MVLLHMHQIFEIAWPWSGCQCAEGMKEKAWDDHCDNVWGGARAWQTVQSVTEAGLDQSRGLWRRLWQISHSHLPWSGVGNSTESADMREKDKGASCRSPSCWGKHAVIGLDSIRMTWHEIWCGDPVTTIDSNDLNPVCRWCPNCGLGFPRL